MNYKLYNGDSANVLKTIESESVDLVVTSPPYDNLRDYKGFVFDFETIANELYRVTKTGGVVVWIVNDATIDGSETGTSFKQALYFNEIGFNIHDTMIWNKNGFTATGALKYRYAQVFEYMFIFSKGIPKTFNPIKDRKNIYSGATVSGTIRQKDGSFKHITGAGVKTIAEYGQRFNVWDISSEKANKTGHPAVFPVRLAKDHIISWSNKGDVVLDPFMGYGTTGVACYETDRDFIGIEISEEYFKMSEDRIASYTAQMKMDI